MRLFSCLLDSKVIQVAFTITAFIERWVTIQGETMMRSLKCFFFLVAIHSLQILIFIILLLLPLSVGILIGLPFLFSRAIIKMVITVLFYKRVPDEINLFVLPFSLIPIPFIIMLMGYVFSIFTPVNEYDLGMAMLTDLMFLIVPLFVLTLIVSLIKATRRNI